MTDVRTFRANTMQEALEIVRTEMGSDAVILHTRQYTQRRFLPWKRPVEQVEITAGLDIKISSDSSRQAAHNTGPTTPGLRRRARNRNRQSTNSAGNHVVQKTQENGRSNPAVDFLKNSSTEPDVTFERTSPQTVPEDAGSSLRSLLAALPKEQLPVHSETASNGQGSNGQSNGELAEKLDSIQKMLMDLGRQGRLSSSNEIPDELFHIYTDLIDAEVGDELARNLVSRLKEMATAEQLEDPQAVKTLLAGIVESEIRCCGPITPEPGKRKVVALVGGTGVGKTTTIAKLAANFRLREGVKMGLVTVDTYRIAAVEQLRTYAEIIDLPMKVVTSPPEMRRALDELVGLDLVLIDTAGRSPRDELQIQELKSLLAEADVDEVHLVMNITASLRTLEATAEKFAAANTTSLIMTKLDEAAGMGTLLSISQKISLPISYLTTGQDVPDDIEPADASRISRLVLGWDKISQ